MRIITVCAALAAALLPACLVATAPVSTASLTSAARCLVKRDARQSMALARTVPGSAQEAVGLAAAAGPIGECLGEARLPATDAVRFQLVGTVAEMARARLLTTRGFDPAVVDASGFPQRVLERGRSLPPEVAIISCAVARDPRVTERLLNSRVASPSERAALAAMTPLIAGCIERGESVRLVQDRIRPIAARVRLTDHFADVSPP